MLSLAFDFAAGLVSEPLPFWPVNLREPNRYFLIGRFVGIMVGKRRETKARRVGREAQIIPMLSSTQDQVATSGFSHEMSVLTEMI